ncbi:MAG: DUF421 domain-containing protein [Clostridia bacterium]|nr:DUF421 domain-containing protein [Clostridia bacterium]
MATTFIKTIIIYLFVLIAVRLMGKRELGQLQPFELVVILIIADVASVPMQDVGTPLFQGIVPILALLVGEIVVSYLNIKFTFFNKLISGRSAVLVDKGKIVEESLKRQRYTIEGLMQEFRIAGYPDISDIEYAILETSGQISIIPKTEKNNVTISDLNITQDKVGYPRVIVREGTVYENNMRDLGLDQKWLDKNLKDRKVNLNDVFVLIVDESNKIYFQKKESE